MLHLPAGFTRLAGDKNSQIHLVCSTCQLFVHQQENVRVKVDQIRSKIRAEGLSQNVSSLNVVKLVAQMCVTLSAPP